MLKALSIRILASEKSPKIRFAFPKLIKVLYKSWDFLSLNFKILRLEVKHSIAS